MNKKELTELIRQHVTPWETAARFHLEQEQGREHARASTAIDTFQCVLTVCDRLMKNEVGILSRIAAEEVDEVEKPTMLASPKERLAEREERAKAEKSSKKHRVPHTIASLGKYAQLLQDAGANGRDPGNDSDRKKTPLENERCVMPRSVPEAMDDRDAVLDFGVYALLIQYMNQFPQECDTGSLMARISQAPLEVPWGLRLLKVVADKVREDGKRDKQPMDTNSPLVQAFFKEYVLDVFDYLDAKYSAIGARFRQSLPADISSMDLDQWCNAWTRSVVARISDWWFVSGHGTLKNVAEYVLTRPRIPQLRELSPLQRLAPAIPSKNNALKLEVRASPFLCQVLEHNPEHWLGSEAGGCAKVIITPGYKNHSKINGKTHYHGLKTAHVYQVPLIQQLAQILEDAPKETSMQETRTVAPPEGLPPELAHELVPAQFKGARALVALHEGRVKPPSREASKWFAGAEATEPSSSLAPTANAATARAPWPVDVKYLDTRHIVLASTDTELGPWDIGRLRTPWPLLGDQVYWLDTVMVVRRDGKWSVLPVVLEAEPLDEDTEIDNADELDEEPEERVTVTLQPQYAEDWPVHELRRALARSQWAYRTDGLGAFLCGAVDLDQRVG